MNRRHFLTWLPAGLVGAAYIPLSWLPVPVPARSRPALEFLTRAYNTACKGLSSKDIPKHLYASANLFDAVEEEMLAIQRKTTGFAGLFTPTGDPTALMFKGASLHRFEPTTLHCWQVHIPLANGGVLISVA